jgi:hypothetical protein
MSWRTLFRELGEWSETLWPEDGTIRKQQERDCLYQSLRQRFEALVRQRRRIEELRQSAASANQELRRRERLYRERLLEMQQIKKQLARLR